MPKLKTADIVPVFVKRACELFPGRWEKRRIKPLPMISSGWKQSRRQKTIKIFSISLSLWTVSPRFHSRAIARSVGS